MIEHEHNECTVADEEEEKFIKQIQKTLKEAGFVQVHPLNTDPLPRAKPKPQATHRLEFSQNTKQYYVVPIVKEYGRS